MKYRVTQWLTLLLTLMIGNAMADDSKQDIQRLIELSGLSSQLETLPGATRTALANTTRSQGGLPVEQERALARMIDRHLQPDVFYHEMIQAAEQAMQPEEIEMLLAWYESEAARAIHACEQEASSTVAYLDMMAEKDRLRADGEQLQRIERLDRHTGATELSTAIQRDTMLMLYVALAHVAESTPVKVEDLRQTIDAYTPQLREQNEEIVTLWMLYAYQYAEEADLADYEAIVSTASHRKFSEAMLRGYRSASSRSITALAAGLNQLASSN